ncbi:MAG TPA: TadE/TadG family type IV pilus assembly protein [Chloroflexota bacterium]|jgi:Flp pilus assembly protein TadG
MQAGDAGRGGRGAAGQALVDLALLGLLLVAMAALIFGGGLLAANWFALHNAAREGARGASRAGITDEQLLAALNRNTALFTGGFTSVVNYTPPADCTASHAVCVCRHPPGAVGCSPDPIPGEQIDVTVRHRVSFLPFAGGVLGQSAAVQLTAVEQARIELGPPPTPAPE